MAEPTPTATCAVPSCGQAVQRHRFFCWPHWRVLPVPLKQHLGRIQLRRMSAGGAALPVDEKTTRRIQQACAEIATARELVAAVADERKERAGP